MTAGTAVATLTPAPAVAWDQELRGAQYLLKSGLCPVALKSPEAALFVILAGRDLGLSPVASLRGLTIIQGKVEVSADLQLGLYHKAGGRSKWVELTDTRASLQLMAPWCEPHVSSFSVDDARRAGLTGDNWRKYPKAMLRSRAITQGLKDIGFDATAGCYSPGEITGDTAVVVEDERVEVVQPLAIEVAHDDTPPPAPVMEMPTVAPTKPNGQPPRAEVPNCPKCGKVMEDHRDTKKGKQPDFKCAQGCKDKSGKYPLGVWAKDEEAVTAAAAPHNVAGGPGMPGSFDEPPDFGPEPDLPF